MWKKISIQIILFSTVILLIFFAYVNYFKSDKKTLVKELKNVEGNKLSLNGKDTNENNLVKNLKYSFESLLRKLALLLVSKAIKMMSASTLFLTSFT